MAEKLSPEPALTRVRFLIISDTLDLQLTNDRSLPFQPPPPDVDVVLHCGDLTDHGTPEDLKKAVEMIGSIKAELRLVIAGNHDLGLDKECWMRNGGSEENHNEAIQIMTGEFAKSHGVTYLPEGHCKLNLTNGADFCVYASPGTPKWGGNAFKYPTATDPWNPPEFTPKHAENTSTERSRIPAHADIVMTHGPPHHVLHLAPRKSGPAQNAGCQYLRRATHHVKPCLHCFGHIHQQYGAQRVDWADQETEDDFELLPQEYVGSNEARRRGHSKLSPASAEAFALGKQTLFINAAIANHRGKPRQVPWLVELDLPASTTVPQT